MSLKIKNGNFEVGIIDLFDFIMNNMDLGEYPEDVMDDLYDYLQWWRSRSRAARRRPSASAMRSKSR